MGGRTAGARRLRSKTKSNDEGVIEQVTEGISKQVVC